MENATSNLLELASLLGTHTNVSHPIPPCRVSRPSCGAFDESLHLPFPAGFGGEPDAASDHGPDGPGPDPAMRLGARVIQNLSESSYTIVNKGFEETVGVDKYHKRGSYVLPLSEAQPLLVKIAGSLVFYDLHTYQPDEKIVNDQKLALAMLRDIAAGTIDLVQRRGRDAQFRTRATEVGHRRDRGRDGKTAPGHPDRRPGRRRRYRETGRPALPALRHRRAGTERTRRPRRHPRPASDHRQPAPAMRCPGRRPLRPPGRDLPPSRRPRPRLRDGCPRPRDRLAALLKGALQGL